MEQLGDWVFCKDSYGLLYRFNLNQLGSWGMDSTQYTEIGLKGRPLKSVMIKFEEFDSFMRKKLTEKVMGGKKNGL